jgi:endonuclease/exonuclease/phosphatase family metal-dependent hydrolase
MSFRRCLLALSLPVLTGAPLFCARAAAEVTAPILTSTSVTFRVMAANLTSGNFQDYQPPGIRIFQGLKPDVVAIQEFNYANNASSDLRSFVSTAFGTNFAHFRESAPGYSIPNGIISRWPITASGSWEDPDAGVNDRGFAWAQIDIPGSQDLYVMSVHLKASSGADNATRRAAEAGWIKGLIQSNFPANAFVVVAGDFNIQNPDEAALQTFKTFLSDSPIPTDAASGGDADTNLGRDERYDYALSSFSLATNQMPVVIGAQSFPNGLVFDSRKFSPLSAVSPVQSGDSGVSGMQHMGVLKDFRVFYTVTNEVPVPEPLVRQSAPGVLRWSGMSNLTYAVEMTSSLTNWTLAGTSWSVTTNYVFTNSPISSGARFFRVRYP